MMSKLYSLLFDDNTNKRTAKGSNKYILNEYVDHSHSKNVIDENRMFLCRMRRIRINSTIKKLSNCRNKYLIVLMMKYLFLETVCQHHHSVTIS